MDTTDDITNDNLVQKPSSLGAEVSTTAATTSTTQLKVYTNCDSIYLVWKVLSHIEGCRGFSLHCKRNNSEEIAETWVGFQGDNAPTGTTRPSTEWPIQKFSWSDYMVRPGDTVSYRVVPMVGDKDHLQPTEEYASEWSESITLDNQGVGSDQISAYFNRGIVACQWLSRSLGNQAEGAEQQELGQII